jgi:CheY-like chemotaxis protein
LAASEERAFDVIVLDLPDSDQLPTARAIRANASIGKRPVLLAVCAAVVSQDLINRLKAAGFDGFIPKPFVPSELAATIRRLCAAALA